MKKTTLKELNCRLSAEKGKERNKLEKKKSFVLMQEQLKYLEKIVKRDMKKLYDKDLKVDIEFSDVKKKILKITEYHTFAYHDCGPCIGGSLEYLCVININKRIYCYGKGVYAIMEKFGEEFNYSEIVLVSDEPLDSSFERYDILSDEQILEYGEI